MLLRVHDNSLPIQHDVNAPIPKTTGLGRHQLHSLADISVIRADAAVSHARPVDGQNLARPTLWLTPCCMQT
jgi:hypothetical protein